MCSNLINFIILPFESCFGTTSCKNEQYNTPTPRDLSPQKLYDLFHPHKDPSQMSGHVIKTAHFSDTHGNIHSYRRCSTL